jgi:hypothetical protein
MLKIEIDTDNAAFEYANGGPELSRLCRRIAERIERGETYGKILDINGNSVGSFELT